LGEGGDGYGHTGWTTLLLSGPFLGSKTKTEQVNGDPQQARLAGWNWQPSKCSLQVKMMIDPCIQF